MLTKKKHEDLLKKGLRRGDFPKYLFKYREIGEFTKDIIINSQFYFASPNTFNDPFDCNLSFKKYYRDRDIKEYKEKLIKRNPYVEIKKLDNLFGKKNENFIRVRQEAIDDMIKISGVFSLSKTYESITMWSHYSKNHEGLVFELDVEQDYDFFNMFGFVKYKKKYEELSFCKGRKKSLRKLILTKYVDWKYEKEIRIIDFNKSGVRKFNNKLISTILFGYKSKKEDIKNIIKLCQDNGFEHVKFKKAKLIPGKFSLDFYIIKKDDFL